MADDWNEDPLLQDLADFAREESARELEILDGRWDLLANGELEAGEAERLAAAGGSGEEARRRYESFRPLGPDFHDRVAAAVLAGAGEGPRTGEVRVPSTPATPVRREAVTRSPVRRSAPRRLAWRLLAAAAALAGAVLFGPRLLAPPFPAYEVAIAPQGEATERSFGEPATDVSTGRSTETPAVFHAGTSFEVAVRPLAPIQDLGGKLEVRCYLAAGPEVRPWPSCAERAEVAPTHAVRISGLVGEDLSLEPGTWTLWIVLGREGKIPDLGDKPAAFEAPSSTRRNWLTLRIDKPLRMEAGP